MKNIIFDIRPYGGAGPLQLGMSPEDAAQIIGLPDHVETDDPDEIRESRFENGLQIVYCPTSKKIVEIGFSSNMIELNFKGLQVFVDRPLKVFKKFLEEDKNPYETLGFIVLLNIGVTLTGFHNNSPDDLAVTLFEKGRWDSIKPKLKAYKTR